MEIKVLDGLVLTDNGKGVDMQKASISVIAKKDRLGETISFGYNGTQFLVDSKAVKKMLKKL